MKKFQQIGKMFKTNNMKTLQLIIKQKFFDEIIAGIKKQEFRECKPTTYKKYFEVDDKGYCIMENDEFIPQKYDAIRFYVGYNPDRATALVEVTGAYIEFFEDENHDLIEYEYKGRYYVASQIVYNLGKVLEKN